MQHQNGVDIDSDTTALLLQEGRNIFEFVICILFVAIYLTTGAIFLRPASRAANLKRENYQFWFSMGLLRWKRIEDLSWLIVDIVEPVLIFPETETFLS